MQIVETTPEVKPFKLHEAIRLGAMLRPQCFLSFFEEGGSCALGAASEALTGKVHILGMELLLEIWPILNRVDIKCPACTCGPQYYMSYIIAHLNDVHMWTRQRIADFVQKIEED